MTMLDSAASRLHAHVQMLAGTIGERNVWRYQALLPLARPPVVGLACGMTPLVRCDRLAAALGLTEVWVKNEGVSHPSLSFKDRVVSVMDPASRHAHKTRSSYRDGYKANVAGEPGTGLGTAHTVTPGKNGDGGAVTQLPAEQRDHAIGDDPGHADRAADGHREARAQGWVLSGMAREVCHTERDVARFVLGGKACHLTRDGVRCVLVHEP